MNKYHIAIIGIILVSFAIGIYLYPQMPERMVSHWGAAGEPNGSMPKAWGLFLMPAISVFMFLLFVFIPKIDPKRKNIEGFIGQYNRFIIVMMIFLFYIYLLTLAWNLGYSFDMIIFLLPAFSVLFFYCGVLISHAKMNYSIGIRTPWTLANEKVWDKTHMLGGKLFKLAAVMMLFGIIFEKYAFIIMILLILSVTVFIIFYSYLEFIRIDRSTKRR